MDLSAPTRVGAPGSDAEFAAVRALAFGNLTRPVITQMRHPGRVWASLANIATSIAEGRRGGEWGATTPVGGVVVKVNPKLALRSTLRFRNAAGTAIGPDELAGRWLDLAGVSLPETVMAAAAGRTVAAVVDAARLHHALADERVVRVEPKAWGVRIVLDLPLVQPDDDDLAAIRAALTPPQE